jgi:glucan biosynthesis protein C
MNTHSRKESQKNRIALFPSFQSPIRFLKRKTNMATPDDTTTTPHSKDNNPPSSSGNVNNIPRSYVYVDNIRSSLTALVIYHHAATTYGGAGHSAYQPTQHLPFSSLTLVCFNAFNQSFFMASFMYLAGYFSRQALGKKKKKSKRQFVKERLRRLALPSVAYTVLGAPLCVAIVRNWKGEATSWRWIVEYAREQRGIRGPIWFTATLFCFDLAMVGFEALREKFHALSTPSTMAMEESREIVERDGSCQEAAARPLLLYASLTLCSAADFLLRTVFPVGTFLAPLNLQPAFISQYVAAYVFGARVRHIEDAIPSRRSGAGLVLVSTSLTCILGQALKRNPDSVLNMRGGWNSLAAVYAVWGNFNGCALGTLVFAGFAKAGWRSFGRTVHAYAFPAFLVHMPVMTLLGVSSDAWEAEPVKKAVAVGTATVVGSWVVGAVLSDVWQNVSTWVERGSENSWTGRAARG